ncbi:MAG TPA: hypothetical protein VLA46_10640, partial [Saprospiraceae bacterium]|nr:hypothetical protein [Saprospiraceae bacterium]
MKNRILLVLLYIFSTTLQAQLDKVWEFTLEGNGITPFSYDTRFRPYLETFETSDGDFITISAKRIMTPVPYTTIYVFRFSPEGEVKWEYEYESIYKIEDKIHDIVMDSNDNMYIGAETTTKYTGGFEPQSSSNALILKISSQGELLWSNESASPPENWFVTQSCNGVDVDNEGNLYSVMKIIDSAQIKTLIEKRDSQGNLIWQNAIPTRYLVNLQIAKSRLVVISSYNETEIYHLNLTDGQIVFTQEIPKVSATKPSFDNDGNWFNIYPTGKFKIDKRNIFGDTLWSFHYPTNLPGNVFADEIEDVCLNADGSIIVTGRHYGPYYGDTTSYSNCDVLTIKLDKNGIPIWTTRYQFNDLRSCQVGKKVLSNEKDFTFVGGYQSVRNGADPYASSDMLILVYDSGGNLIDSTYYDEPDGKDDNGVNLVLKENSLYLLGWTEQNDSLFDQTVVKYSYGYVLQTEDEKHYNFKIFPNPTFSDELNLLCEENPLSATLIDITGRPIFESQNIHCNSKIQLPFNLLSGCYYLQLQWPFATTITPVMIMAR